jgi:undecaprenyl diphosphate synthase
MNQSTFFGNASPGLHVAIIMDGNGRWAVARGLPRTAGHQAGVEAVRRVVQAAPRVGIGTLTLFAFSTDNWDRPTAEVEMLMQIFGDYFLAEVDSWVSSGTRVNVIGRRDRIPPLLRTAIEMVEAETQFGEGLHLRIALDYSARDAIVRAARRVTNATEVSQTAFARLIAEATHSIAPPPDIDLLIRTGGEHRLSDLLLWECAYAEIVFTSRLWPDFGPADLESAVGEFHTRERRFGRLPEMVAG